ncbi:MAG: hypothetical protein ACOZAJ_02805 [Patescibacteria group bacterium]
MRKEIWLLIVALLIAIIAVCWFIYWQPNNPVAEQTVDLTPAPVAPSEVMEEKIPTTNPFEVPVNPYESYVNPFSQTN